MDDVVVRAYRVEWPGGSKAIVPGSKGSVGNEPFVLHPRETALRTVRIDAGAGDSGSLDPAHARVVVVEAAMRPPGLSAAEERAACDDLASDDLPKRVDAAQRIVRAQGVAVAGGTEQVMEAAAAYCERVHKIHPPWWQPPK